MVILLFLFSVATLDIVVYTLFAVVDVLSCCGVKCVTGKAVLRLPMTVLMDGRLET